MLKFNSCKKAMIRALKTATNATMISLDHTFRFSKFVTIQSSKGHNFKKAFSALLLVVNENGEVVDFMPTADQSLKTPSVTEMLHNINDRCPNINLVMADNCCQSRSCLVDVFENSIVKLDLWHALNRVRRTLLRKNVLKVDRIRFNR